MFKQYNNILSPELLKTLQDSYMRDDIAWTHRNFGRFFIYLTPEHHEAVLEELYTNENLPVYHNKKMMRHHHMYIQRFIPGSWLPLHREKCYGVLTMYLNPDEDWSADNPGPKFTYYSTDDLSQLESHKHQYEISCNTGTIFMTSLQDKAPEYNSYHKVEYNESETSRYGLQMFFGPGPGQQKPDANVPGFRSYRKTDSYADTNVDMTTRAVMSGELDVPSVAQLPKAAAEFIEENREIIERLTSNG